MNISRLALLILSSLATLCAAHEPKPSELESQGIEAMHAGEYQQAEDVFRALIELRPQSFVGHYNLAAAHSMQGEIKDSIASISNALALGFSDRLQLERDPDLKQLRESAFFGQLMEQWGALIESRRAGDLKLLRGLIKKDLLERTDELYRLELLSAHDETATDQAHDELLMIAEWAQSTLFTGLRGYELNDSPWIVVVLPDRAGFLSWAVTTFGPSVQGSISSVGGAYEHQQRRLVAQDLGATLRHEFIHVLHWRDMNRLGQAHAAWVQEGLASLIEDYDMRGDRPVPVASWRTNIVKRQLEVNRLPSIEKLTQIEMNAFTAKRPLAQYAQARTLMLWLYETGKLRSFYDHYCAHFSADPSGYQSLIAATGFDEKELDTQYRRWVADLRSVPETGSDLPATLGIEIENGSGDGVVVKALPGNASTRTGLRLGSVITHINDRPTRDLFELIRVLGDYRAGERVTLHHRRGKIHSTSETVLLGQ